MPTVWILALGLMPALAVATWEVARYRRRLQRGFGHPVSPEAVRWVQYAGAAYVLGFAGLAMAYVDGRGESQAAALLFLAVIASTCLASCLLLWGLGLKYGSDTPRLTEMRADIYRCRVLVHDRAVLLRRLSHRGLNQSCWTLAAEAERGGELMQRCTEQLARIQSALTTREFVRRVSDAARGSAEVRLLRDEQAALLNLAEDFLVETVPQPAVVGWSAVRS